ncbi:MAG: methyl-accepting chemotaxis protein [Cyanobacteriota bacterium]
MSHWKKIKAIVIVLTLFLVYFVLSNWGIVPSIMPVEYLNMFISMIAILICALFFITELLVLKPIKDCLSSLKTLANSIINATERLAHSSEEYSSSSEVVSQDIVKITNASDEQSELMSQTYNNLELISELISETEKKASEGTKLVDTTIDSMSSINESVSDISREVDELNIDSNKISIIVELITEIASQTNLLSLNAAVEAARAGEHGRGFNIVAEEVRKLARQSEDAAKQAFQLVNSISARIQQVASCTDESVKQVNQGTKYANDSSRIFYEIKNLLDQQVSKSKDMLTIVNTALDASKNNTDQARIIATSTEKQSKINKQIEDKANNLAEISNSIAKVLNDI